MPISFAVSEVATVDLLTLNSGAQLYQFHSVLEMLKAMPPGHIASGLSANLKERHCDHHNSRNLMAVSLVEWPSSQKLQKVRSL